MSVDVLDLIVTYGLEVNRVNSLNKTLVWYGSRDCVVTFDRNYGSATEATLDAIQKAVERQKSLHGMPNG